MGGLPATVNKRRQFIRIQQALRVTLGEPEWCGGRDRRWTENIRNQQIIHKERRIESEHALAALADGMTVEHAIRPANDPT